MGSGSHQTDPHAIALTTDCEQSLPEPVDHRNARIEQVKAMADALADADAQLLRVQLMGNPLTALRATAVKPNYRHFRRLAGLRGRDARERD